MGVNRCGGSSVLPGAEIGSPGDSDDGGKVPHGGI